MKTILHDKHVALNAKMINFAGWEMPVQYTGIISEHLNVRKAAGLFDVSHMGRILISGKDAEPFLDYLSTNKIANKKNLSATYTVWCLPNGGCVDDLIVYKHDHENFFVIVNASNRESDLAHVQSQAKKFNVTIEDRYDQEGILALQGPKAEDILSKLFPDASSISDMHFLPLNSEMILSRTGYTGSGGFEIYASLKHITTLWDEILKAGKSEGICPAGLGCRDTLRLEMGYALYGHEISESIPPTESVSAWTVKMDKEDFLGKNTLKLPAKRSEYGVILLDKGVARENYPILKDGLEIGKVTSGNYAPSLNASIAIILIEDKLHIGDLVDIKIRDHLVRAQVVPLPFYQKGRQ